MLREQAGNIEKQLGVQPAAVYRVPSAQTQAAVEAVQYAPMQLGVQAIPSWEETKRSKERSSIQLIAGKIAWVHDKYLSGGDIVKARPDLEEEDLLQMGAVSILEAAQHASLQTDRPSHAYIHERSPRLMRAELIGTKLVPEKYGNKVETKPEAKDRAAPIEPSSMTHALEVAADDEEDLIEHASRKIVAQQIAGLLGGLQERQQLVLEMRYGLNGQPEHTLQVIGDELGLTRQAVNLIEKEALAELREAAEHRGWV